MNGQKQDFKVYIKIKTYNEYINITIWDNGVGFEESALTILNDASKRMPQEHIGIYNIKQRFELVFGEKCNFCFSNRDGACVDIFIPFLDEKERK